jgi:hypothetical protein
VASPQFLPFVAYKKSNHIELFFGLMQHQKAFVMKRRPEDEEIVLSLERRLQR